MKESRRKTPDPKPSVEECHLDGKKCPMCGESVGLGNALQLHYLTKCKGHNEKGKEKRKKRYFCYF